MLWRLSCSAGKSPLSLSLSYPLSRYDVGISNALLPMVNAHEIYPSWEDELHSAYVHLNMRLSPAWLETEPAEIIQACKDFVDGYNTIFADDFMT
jgi:hypothetical protein